MGDEIIAFVHIPRTSGSTILKQIHKNFSSDSYLELSPEALQLTEKDGYKKYLESTQKLISGLSMSERGRIKIVYGHCLPYGLHNFFEREVKYVTILRDPQDRIESIYNYLRGLSLMGAIEERLEQIFYIDGRTPSFEEWYLKKFNKGEDFGLMSTDRLLSRFGFDKDLKQFYFTGIMEKNDDRLFLYCMFGVERVFASENVSRKFYKGKRKIQGLAGANSVYELGKKRSIAFERGNINYKRAIKDMKSKSKNVYFNQLVYDLSPTIRKIKHGIALRR